MITNETSSVEPITNPLLGAVTLTLAIITVIGNLITVLAILKSRARSLKRPHITLICCLSIVDFFIGLFHVLFVAIACFTGRWLDITGDLVEKWDHQILNNRPWCKISSFLVQPLFKMAISTVAVIGLERILTMRYPLKSETLITNVRCIFVLLLTWIIVVCLLAQEIFSQHVTVYMMPAYQCIASYGSANDVEFIIWTSMAVNSVSFFIIIVASAYTFFTLLKLRRKAQTQMGEAKDASQTKMIMTATILTLMCIDTSTWLPQYVATTLRYLLPDTPLYYTLVEYNLRTSVWWIQYLSPALNPVIYALRLKAVRREILAQTKAFAQLVYPDYKRNSVNAVAVHVPMLNRTRGDSCWSEGGHVKSPVK